MARTKWFTRSIKSKDVLVRLINKDTLDISECVVNVPDGEDVESYVEETTGLVLVNIVEETDIESKYKMELNTFLANATKVDK